MNKDNRHPALPDYTPADLAMLDTIDIKTVLRLCRGNLTNEQKNTVYTTYKDSGDPATRLTLGEMINAAIIRLEEPATDPLKGFTATTPADE